MLGKLQTYKLQPTKFYEKAHRSGYCPEQASVWLTHDLLVPGVTVVFGPSSEETWRSAGTCQPAETTRDCVSVERTPGSSHVSDILRGGGDSGSHQFSMLTEPVLDCTRV